MPIMTSRERMIAAIRHQPVDRVPVAPWGMGRIPMDSSLGRELIARTDPWIEVPTGCDPVGGATFPIERHRRGNVEIRVIHAADRDLTATWTTTGQTTACTEYFCKTVDDVHALLSIPYVQPEPDVAAFHAMRERIGEDALVCMGLGDGLCYPNDMLGTEFCSLLWALQPEIILQMVARAAERTYRVIEAACEGGVDCFRIVGGEYATQLMGQRAWDELVVPFDGPLVELMHGHGAIAHYHNHGYMQRFIDQIAELGVDSLDPIEQPPYGDIEMGDGMGRIGDRVCLVGGLDDMEVLEIRDTAEVLALADAIMDDVRAATGCGDDEWPTGYMLAGTSSGIYGEPAARHFIAVAEHLA